MGRKDIGGKDSGPGAVLQRHIRRMIAMQWRFRRRLARTGGAILALAAARYVWSGQSATQSDWQTVARLRMVDEQIKARGIRTPAVLDVMARVPRHLFVPPAVRHRAYEDTPLPIGQGQTISQPFIVAYMTEALQISRDHVVLEIGTGSGYQAAVLAEMVHEVYTIEIVADLAERARRTLAEAGYRNVHVRTGNGYLGWPDRAPFPRIIVTAAPDEIPSALLDQLAVGGTMVLPVGTLFQEMTIVTKDSHGVTQKKTIPVRFVPMVDKPG
jgi:protein-L-isoaspartate(D-aspartate) O-methyltransferase